MGGQTAAHLFLNGGRIQDSGVAGVTEFGSLSEDFPREMLVPDSRIKTLLTYSATPDS